MEIDAGKANSEKPTQSENDLKRPNWLVRVVWRLIPPGPGSANEIIDVLLETHGSIAQAVLRIPVLIAVPALGWAREVFYWKMAIAQAAILVLAEPGFSMVSGRRALWPSYPRVCRW